MLQKKKKKKSGASWVGKKKRAFSTTPRILFRDIEQTGKWSAFFVFFHCVTKHHCCGFKRVLPLPARVKSKYCAMLCLVS